MPTAERFMSEHAKSDKVVDTMVEVVSCSSADEMEALEGGASAVPCLRPAFRFFKLPQHMLL